MIVFVVGLPPVYSSVAVEAGLGLIPPNAKADACVPAPAKLPLAVFKVAVVFVQLEPSYSSVAPA